MKLAYDHQIFSMQRHGGISRYFSALIEHISDKTDMQVTVISPVHINEYLRRQSIKASVRGKYVPFHFRGAGRVLRAANRALLPMAWRGEQFDIIHETYYSSTASGRSKARVVTLHDMIHERYPEEFPNAAKVIREKRAAVRRADHIICVSETTQRDATAILGLQPAKSSVIYLGCSLGGIEQISRKHIAISPCVLYVGQRGGYKNFDVLLKAFAASKLTKMGIELIAFGGPRFAAHEEFKIRRLGVSRYVRWRSGSDALLQEYYRTAAALVYPSRYEGFGIPPLEAMTAGCPVICSTAPSIKEIVGDAGAYFDPEDDEALRALLERSVEDVQFCDQLRTRGERRVAEFSWAKCATETLGLYGKLVAANVFV